MRRPRASVSTGALCKDPAPRAVGADEKRPQADVCMCVYIYIYIYIYVYIYIYIYKSYVNTYTSRGRKAATLRGNNLSNTTCLTQALFKSCT